MRDPTNIADAKANRDSEGRVYSWESFRIWLHDRLYKKNSHKAKETAAKERKRLNDKVLQNLGIVPGKNGLNNKKR
jgi:hypothetical protein